MNTVDTISHEDAVDLLPWLVNDSLQADERVRVMQHAQSCVVCRRDLEELTRIREMVEFAKDAEPVPEPDMRLINARIDALIEKQTLGRRIGDGVREFFTEPWRIAFAVQTAILLALGTVFFWPNTDPPEFRTLTSDSRELPQGYFVRVVLDPDSAPSEADNLLQSLGLAVIDGPSERGVYTLGFVKPVTLEDRNTIIEQLTGDPIVLFAQPVGDGEGR